MLKSWQRFRGKKCNVFTEELNKIELNAKDDNRMQSTNS